MRAGCLAGFFRSERDASTWPIFAFPQSPAVGCRQFKPARADSARKRRSAPSSTRRCVRRPGVEPARRRQRDNVDPPQSPRRRQHRKRQRSGSAGRRGPTAAPRVPSSTSRSSGVAARLPEARPALRRRCRLGGAHLSRRRRRPEGRSQRRAGASRLLPAWRVLGVVLRLLVGGAADRGRPVSSWPTRPRVTGSTGLMFALFQCWPPRTMSIVALVVPRSLEIWASVTSGWCFTNQAIASGRS